MTLATHGAPSIELALIDILDTLRRIHIFVKEVSTPIRRVY